MVGGVVLRSVVMRCSITVTGVRYRRARVLVPVMVFPWIIRSVVSVYMHFSFFSFYHGILRKFLEFLHTL